MAIGIFSAKINDKLGTILFNILRRSGIENFALTRFVDLLSSEKNIAIFFVGGFFSAEIIF